MGLFDRLFGGGSGNRLPEVDAATVRQWQSQGDCLLIDVREDSEFRAERIAGARLAPLSRLERSVPALPTGKKTVFLCQSGGRTRMQSARLAACGSGEAYVLKGGLMGWKTGGFPTEQG